VWSKNETGLRLAPAPVQNPFGIAVRLRPSLEDQVAGGVEGRAEMTDKGKK
jgi:hypothetical protein